MFDLLNNKPIWNLYEWYIETNNIQGQKYFLVGVSDQYEKGRPIRSSICNKIDFENCMAETKNSYYKLCVGDFSSRKGTVNITVPEWNSPTAEQILNNIKNVSEKITKEDTDEQKMFFKNSALLQNVRLLVLNEMDSRKWDIQQLAEYIKVDVFELHTFLTSTLCNVSFLFISKLVFFANADITTIKTTKVRSGIKTGTEFNSMRDCTVKD